MQERLAELLHQLHAELASADTLDEQARDSLRAIAQEIESAIGPEDDSEVGGETLSQLQDVALSIESEYPRLSAVVGNLADTLSKLGI